jgi:prepilin signal peptidase PulO-like enzyme (type II secretory pathway)
MSFFVIILGLLVGSFLNCLAYRLPRQEKFIWARSHCPSCQKVLSWLELLPVVSFIIQKARCRVCKQKISWLYPIAEIFTALAFWAVIINFQLSIFNKFSITQLLTIFFYLFITSILILIFLIDLNDGVILDSIIWPSVIVIFICQWLLGLSVGSFLGAMVIGGGFFGLQYLLSRGRWIGSGDIGLGVLMGVILGWPSILFALFLAYISGAIVGLSLIVLKKKDLQSTVPFGAFLAPATFVAILWGQTVIGWYWHFLN